MNDEAKRIEGIINRHIYGKDTYAVGVALYRNLAETIAFSSISNNHSLSEAEAACLSVCDKMMLIIRKRYRYAEKQK